MLLASVDDSFEQTRSLSDTATDMEISNPDDAVIDSGGDLTGNCQRPSCSNI